MCVCCCASSCSVTNTGSLRKNRLKPNDSNQHSNWKQNINTRDTPLETLGRLLLHRWRMFRSLLRDLQTTWHQNWHYKDSSVHVILKKNNLYLTSIKLYLRHLLGCVCVFKQILVWYGGKQQCILYNWDMISKPVRKLKQCHLLMFNYNQNPYMSSRIL